jgi:hypothetical protein
MVATSIEKAIDHLQAAILLLEGRSDAESKRNPKWFRDTGHLSDKGVEHLFSLFAKGKTTYAASKEMDISYRATSLRHDEWRRKYQKA